VLVPAGGREAFKDHFFGYFFHVHDSFDSGCGWNNVGE
jgi:hypothetical protein